MIFKRHTLIYGLCFLLFTIAVQGQADSKTIEDIPSLEDIEHILRQPEERIRLTDTRLLIEAMIYPDVNIKESIKRIDAIASTIKAMPEYGTLPTQRLGTALRYLYTPGSWNNYTAYHYNLDDPFGKKQPEGKSVARYLKTKRGNCVSMPLLLAMLAEKLDVKVHLSVAPHHMFLRYRDENGHMINIETTSGTLIQDKTYIERFHISPQAIKHGIYLQDLTKKEAITFMLYEIGRTYLLTRQTEQAHKIADMMLRYNPKQVNAMLLKGSLYYQTLQQELSALKAKGQSITSVHRAKLDPLFEQNQAWFAKAEQLGWQQPPPNFDRQYAQAVEAFKHQAR